MITNREIDGARVTGTLMWYLSVCRREVWLMGHGITPDEENDRLELGRAIHQRSYKRSRKELGFEGFKIDVLKGDLVYEVKTSSRFFKAARLQLLFYLFKLKEMGLEKRGVIAVPLEKKKFPVTLDSETEMEVRKSIKEIKDILLLRNPPLAIKIPACRRCAYRDFCWS